MKKTRLLSVYLFAGFGVFSVFALAYLCFGPHKMHFSMSHQSKTPFEQTATSSGASDVTFHSLDGEPTRLSAYKGQVVILHRWGTWCIPCVAEMPGFQKLYDRYRNDPQVRFVAAASRDTPAEVKAFANRNHYDLPFYIADEEEETGVSVSTFPQTLFYAKDGGLKQTMTGAIDWDSPSITALIETLKHS